MMGGKHESSAGGRDTKRRSSLQRRRPSFTQTLAQSLTQMVPEKEPSKPKPKAGKKSLFRGSSHNAADSDNIAIANAAAAMGATADARGAGGGQRKKRGSFLFKKHAPAPEPETPATSESPWKSPQGEATNRSNDDILAEINHLVDESGDSGSINNLIITTADTQFDDMSFMTDDFRRRPSDRGLTGTGAAAGNPRQQHSFPLHNAIEDTDFSGSGRTVPHHHQRIESNVLFTFQRRGRPRTSGDAAASESSVFETTLNAKTAGQEEESMEAIVKRLQQKGSSSGVLKFDKSEIRQIKAGSKDIVFVLVQVNGAKFSKDEFGRMMASEVAGLTPDRPILIEIQTEDVVEGETLNVF